MSGESTAGWGELSRLWQAEGAAISLEELEGYMKRERAMMRALAAVELAGLGLGVAVGVWLSMATPYAWMARVFIVFCAAMAWIAWRRRSETAVSGGEDLLTSLRASIAREDGVASRLRFGRALSFVVLFAVLMTASHLLRVYASTSAASLWALLSCGLWLCAIIAWNLGLVRRSRRRRQRLESFAERLKTHDP